jgi:adenylate cyclase
MNPGELRQLQDAMQWALESAADAPLAAVDWLARDICTDYSSAAEMLTRPDVPLHHLHKAKHLFKTMRVLGETAADRRVGGQMYLAAIAAGLVVHGQRISRQSDEALSRALTEMVNSEHLAADLRALAQAAIAHLQAAPSSTSPHGAATSLEIERTYLLDCLPALPANAKPLQMMQGYLPDDAEMTGRLRCTRDADGNSIYTHTIKQGAGLVRSETERTISKDEFDTWWPQTEGRRLSKTRYRVIEGDRVWEIDVFDDLHLVLAEVELPSETSKADPPPWLAGHVVRDVTEEKGYCNYELAMRLGNTKR